ncbi:MAG: redox-regulated ATPase YchF [Anaerovoracaceae bacterium]
MKLGIVGLPNVGKSTLFNAITQAGAEAANYPFCTIEPNVGVVTVPDKRIDYLDDVYKAKKKIYATIEFADIAGLVQGASKGEGLGNKFLGHIREAAAIVHVVRCFTNDNVVHVDGKVSPKSDIEVINTELLLADLEMVEKKVEKLRKQLKADKSIKVEIEILERIISCLEAGNSARSLDVSSEEDTYISSLGLLSYKPIIYVANISEEEIGNSDNQLLKEVKEIAKQEGAELVTICSKVEEELSQLSKEEKELFLEELGIKESGLEQLVASSYRLLKLRSFLTAGEPEVRAWTIKAGTKAPGAAGKIHSDFEKGFIRAETVAFEKLKECGGNLVIAKEKGLVRAEGKEYIVKDGDVMHFLFNR